MLQLEGTERSQIWRVVIAAVGRFYCIKACRRWLVIFINATWLMNLAICFQRKPSFWDSIRIQGSCVNLHLALIKKSICKKIEVYDYG